MQQQRCSSAERHAVEMIQSVAYAETREEIVSGIFHSLERALGFDTSMLLSYGGAEPITWNKSPRQLACWNEAQAIYVADVALFDRAAAQSRDVVNDESLPREQRDRMKLYSEYMRPWHISNTLALFVRRGKRTLQAMALCRHAQSRFSSDELERMRFLLPSIAVATRLLPGVPVTQDEPRDLTSRQLQIVELVGRGLRNREIASVCGTSPNTVRNQLVSIFGKLEVTTRGELIARAAASGLLTPFQ